MIASKIPAFWHNPSHFIKFILPESGSAVLLCHIRHKTLFLIQFEGRRTCALIFIVWLEPQDITRWLPPSPSLSHLTVSFYLNILPCGTINPHHKHSPPGVEFNLFQTMPSSPWSVHLENSNVIAKSFNHFKVKTKRILAIVGRNFSLDWEEFDLRAAEPVAVIFLMFGGIWLCLTVHQPIKHSHVNTAFSNKALGADIEFDERWC